MMAGRVIWLTGMSGAGKSTIASALKGAMDPGSVCVLDGDELRAGLCSDLGFSEADKREQTRRAAEVARIISMAGMTVIVALISPYAESRDTARRICSGVPWFEVYVRCSEDERRRRDPKGLYARLDAGQIAGMSGIDAPYEEPLSASVVIDTGIESVKKCVERIVDAFGGGSA
jgi:bifunctional enzyme CysN/CysC